MTDPSDPTPASTEGAPDAPATSAAGPKSPAPTPEPETDSMGDPDVSSTTGVSARRWAKLPVWLLVAVLAFLAGRGLGARGEEAEAQAAGAAAAPGAEATIWTCSMHPQIRMNEPGKCPICGMDLIPATSAGGDEEDEPTVVRLSPRARALAAVRTVEVRRAEGGGELRLLGRVEVDETRLRAVTPWIGGRIDRLRVRETGVRIRRGQVVADLYSPEVYAALEDLSVAVATRRRLGDDAYGSAGAAEATVRAAREKLRLLGVDEALVAKVEGGAPVPDHVPVRARVGGTVLRRNVEQGDYVTPASSLFDVADLSVVWVQLEAYETDLPRIHVGAEVFFEAEGLEEPFVGKVVFVDPVVDPRRRIARVRVEVPNRDGILRPGMFGTAVVATHAAGAGSLTIPTSAVLFTGRRSVVYVERAGEEGVYELRLVHLGPRIGDRYVVAAGLSEGERVVAKGAFFLDADLQLRGGRSMMTIGGEGALSDAPALVVTEEARAAVAPVVEAYLEAAAALAADDEAGAKKALAAMADRIGRLDVPGPVHTRRVVGEILSALSGHARMAEKADDLAGVRTAFEMLAAPMVDLLERFGNPTDRALVVVRCPMAFDAKGARWVQPEGTVKNPYFGSKMIACGNREAHVGPKERLVRLTLPPAEKPPAKGGGHAHAH